MPPEPRKAKVKTKAELTEERKRQEDVWRRNAAIQGVPFDEYMQAIEDQRARAREYMAGEKGKKP